MKKGWEKKKLGEVCQLINGRAYNKQELLSKGKYTVLRVGNFFTNDNWYYSDLELDKDKYCDTGDLLYAWSASFGPKIWDGGKVIYHYHIWKVIPNTELVTKEFLYHLLDWDKEQIKIDQGAGTTMTHVSKGSMEDRLVPIPPLPEQQRIVSLLDETFTGLAQVHANAERNLVNAREVFEAALEEVFQNAKTNWHSKVITDLCEIGDGNHGGNYPKKSDMRKTGVPFIRSVNLVNGHISDDDMRFISKEKHDSLNKGHLKTGDVLFTNRGEMGKSAVVDSRYDDANLNSQIAFFRCSQEILPWYLYYILQSPYMQEHSTKSQTGAALQQLPIGIISKFEIPVPPLEEQRAIVERLDGLAAETSRLEAVYQSKLEAVAELRKSVLQKAFEGEV